MVELEKLCLDPAFKKLSLENEDRKSMLDLNTKLNFVESKNKKQSAIMKTSFSVAKDSGMNPVWVTFEQALNMAKELSKSHAFIIDSFRTELYDKLQNNSNCHIYGPSCIFYCTKQLNLPCRRFPIFNLCMRSLEICIDSERFEEDDVLQLFGLTTLMCGTFSHTFRPTTTHLISNNLTTEKSKLARTYGIPIVSKDWIKDCWEKSLNTEINPNDKAIVEKFRLPIFYNFQINISQIDNAAKTKIQRLIVKNGGEQVACNLKKLTHLILGEPTGGKYEAAKAMCTIKIVKEAWIHDSVKMGYALIENDYLFESSNSQTKFCVSEYQNLLSTTSTEQFRLSSSEFTQNRDRSTCPFTIQSTSKISSQVITPMPETASQYSNALSSIQADDSLDRRSQKENSQKIPNNTMCTQKNSLKPPQENGKQTYCIKSKAELAKNIDNLPRRTAYSVLTSSSQKQSEQASASVERELEKLVGQLATCRSSTFDGCDFYINDNSITSNVRNLLKRSITLQNGTISTSLRQSVSHVIVREDLSEAERSKLNKELDRFDHTINQVSLKWIIKCSKSSKLLHTIDLNSVSQQSSQDYNSSQFSLNGWTKQHLELSTSQQSLRQSQRISRLKKSTQFFNEPTAQSSLIRDVVPKIRTDDDIFNDYSDCQNNSTIQSYVVDNSQVSSRPQAIQKLRCALDLESMRPEEKPLFKCVLTISSYLVNVKEELTKLANRLGAICQLEFVKNDKLEEGKYRNTHLVCEEANGPKYERALKWGVYCVNQEWLRKCEELGKRVDEGQYPPKKPTINSPKESYESQRSTVLDTVQQEVNSCPTGSALNSQISGIRSVNKNSTNASQISSDISTTADPTIIQTNASLNTSTSLSQSNVLSKFGELRTILNGNSNKTNTAKVSNNTLVADERLQIAVQLASPTRIAEKSMNEKINKIDQITRDIELISVEKRPIDILSDDRFKKNPKKNLPIGWNEQRLDNRPSKENKTLSLPVNLTSSTMIPNQECTRSEIYSDESMIRNRLIERENISSFAIHEDTSTQLNAQIVFNFSGYSLEEKQEFGRKLARINIKIIQDSSLDFDYLITNENKLIKNELFFVSVAKGKWICHPDFYRRTLELGALPDPEQYEWGSNKKHLNRLESKFVQLAKACRYWRIKVAETKQFAFHGQRHVVISKNAKNYASIIQNGGGKAMPVEMYSQTRESYEEVLKEVYRKLKNGSLEAEYLLINLKKKERDHLNLADLVKPIEALNVKCLLIDYLSLFLVSDTHLQINNILINPVSLPSSLKRTNSNDDLSSNPNPKAIKR